MNIAILGATSHIAKNLIYFFCKDPQYQLLLFARNLSAVRSFVLTIGSVTTPVILGFEAFAAGDYDAVINCVGIADPGKQKNAGIELFRLTEHFDNMVLDYLANHDQTVYVNFTSGAVYGTSFASGVTEESEAVIAVNNIGPADYYRIAKLNSEAKHRAMVDRRIIDLRVFSFFSRFIDLEAGFLLCAMTRCAKEHKVFHTNAVDIMRDYVAPSDLFALVATCIRTNVGNLALDVYSVNPVRKSELIELYAHEFGLEAHNDETRQFFATGMKLSYYSSNLSASHVFGYSPVFSSIDAVRNEAMVLLT